MPTQLQVVEERSLEQIAEALERRQAREEREDDAEAAIDELIREMADIHASSHDDEEFIRGDEFSCQTCHLVLHRSLLGDPVDMVCEECIAT
jgi:hypothetical protein